MVFSEKITLVCIGKWKTIESWDVLRDFYTSCTLKGRGFLGHNSSEHNNLSFSNHRTSFHTNPMSRKFNQEH